MYKDRKLKIAAFILFSFTMSIWGESASKIERRAELLTRYADSLDLHQAKTMTKVNLTDPFARITANTKLLEQPPPSEERILDSLNPGDSVYLFNDETSDYYYVEANEKKGYVLKKTIEKIGERIVDSLKKEFKSNDKKLGEARTKISELKIKSMTQRAKDYLNQKAAEKNRRNQIKIGMNSEMAMHLWGKPGSRNKSVGSWGVREQWVYQYGYLNFENGFLTSYQTSE